MATKDINDTQAVLAATVRWAMHKAGCKDAPSTGEILAKITGEPEKVCWRAVERAIRHGFLAYGVSLGSSYPTGKGEALLATALNEKALGAMAPAFVCGGIDRVAADGKIISN